MSDRYQRIKTNLEATLISATVDFAAQHGLSLDVDAYRRQEAHGFEESIKELVMFGMDVYPDELMRGSD